MLPGWMPDELRQLGYDGIITGEGQRILPHAIEQKLTLTSSGACEVLTEGSTKPVAQIRTPMPGSRACCGTASPWNDMATSGLRGKAEALGSVRGLPSLTQSGHQGAARF
jgi:hypothetical protein